MFADLTFCVMNDPHLLTSANHTSWSRAPQTPLTTSLQLSSRPRQTARTPCERLNRMPDRTPCFAFSLWSHLQLLSRRHSATNTQLVSTHRCSDIKYMIRIDLFGSNKQTSSSARYLNELTNRQDALVIITQCHLLPRDDWELTGSVLNTRWCVIPYFCLWSCSIKLSKV